MMIEKPVEPFYYENQYFVIRHDRRDQTSAYAPEYIGEHKEEEESHGNMPSNIHQQTQPNKPWRNSSGAACCSR